MKDWNVVVSVFQDGYSRALRALQKLGAAERSPYHNVLVMKVADPAVLLEAIEKKQKKTPRFTTRSRAWHRPCEASTFCRRKNLSRKRK